MAIPTTAIEVWAYEDYILPNTHELNKERPIDDLWKKGYDMGQKPSVEHWNYLFNLTTDWLRYLTKEQIPGLDDRFFQITNNLSEVLDPAAARENLGVYGKEESDGKFVKKAGDTMTGPLTLPRLNFLASSTDSAYITTTTPASDVTYLDICITDNAGQPGTGIVDSIRFMFENASLGKIKMAEINSTDGVTGYLRVFGQFRANQVNVDGPLVWTGAGNGGSLYLSGAGNMGSLTVRGSSFLQDLTASGVTATGMTVNGTITTNSLTVVNNSAVVGGRNVVRAVNGLTADGNGNLTLTFPETGVTDVRLSQEGIVDKLSFVPWSEGRRAQAPAGSFITSVADYQTDKQYIEDVDAIWYRYVQKQIGGVWYNVATL